jgi:hypothetical protein
MIRLNENALSRSSDFFYALRFLRLLTTDWKDTNAFKFGIIDDAGKVLRKAKDLKTTEEKATYTVFHRLVFNLKRLLNKVPGGKSKLASYATALFLIKENTGLGDDSLITVISEVADLEHNLVESTWFETSDSLKQGVYTLNNDAASVITGEIIALKGTQVVAEDTTNSIDFLGARLYLLKHKQTNQMVCVSSEDIRI